MDVAIIQFPGSNCERETMLAVKRCGMNPVEVLWNQPAKQWQDCAGFIIIGGFSYEDRSRAGIIAALDPIMTVLKAQSNLGKPILGICNGAQILVESGLIPGFQNYAVHMALTDNQRIKEGKVVGAGYYNAWVHLKPSKNHRANAFTRYLNNDSVLRIPIAHAEGRFVIPPHIMSAIESNHLTVFQYGTEEGDIVDEFPINPNGSINNIAAMTNLAGNVLAIMPHPERTPIGDPLFLSMRDYMASNPQGLPPQFLDPIPSEGLFINDFVKSPNTHELIIELMIADNHALSVESTLRKKGIMARIKRQIHWEIACPSEEMLKDILASHLLYNDRKEMIVKPQNKKPGEQTLLVRAKEDMLGRQTLQHLKEQAGLQDIKGIQHSVLWQIKTEPDRLEETLQCIIETGILFNPASHECFRYD
jgi:phosphoribosylformylglycinamidine synthase